MGGALVFADLALPPTIPFLEWRWDDLLFLILAGILLAAAFFVVIGRDIIRSGLSMILAFGALAGIYVLLGAVVVAAAQVLIYIGAISVLILFAIMLTQTKGGPLPLVFHRQWWAGALAAIGVVALLFISIINTDWPGKLADRLWTATDQIALLLFADPLYVLSIEVVGILLTAAVVGGVFLAKQERSADPAEPKPSILERQRRPVDLAASATPVSPSAASAAQRREAMSHSLEAYLILSALLFGIGVFGFLARRNAIAMLMSIELMLNGVNLSAVAFGAFTPSLQAHAALIALLVMAVAAAEATVGLAIVVAIYRNRRTPLVDEYSSMRE